MSPQSTLDLIGRAHDALADAYAADGTAERHRCARLAALRAAVAVLTTSGLGSGNSRSGGPGSLSLGSGGPRDPWPLLARHVPELAEWADYFAVVGERTAALTASRAVVGVREADDLLRAAESFVNQARPILGLSPASRSVLASGSTSPFASTFASPSVSVLGLAPAHPTPLVSSA